jgi:para-nitrobenzyl esterase
MHKHTVRATVNAGIVEGFTRDGVSSWRSIPYARPPLGRLRFRAPRPVEPWPGVRYCHGFAYCAPQERKYTLLGVGKFQPMSEDCLTLNVVAPESRDGGPPDGPLPVMVFIHGGAYFAGSSAIPLYKGASMARRGCVFVSVNYRLGALGCVDFSTLSTPTTKIEGNLFLRDLVMALRWVRDNIAVFGGDPDNVTIFGESAGAHAVATLLAVPAAKGLFARAISESPASGLLRPSDAAAEFAARFVESLGARRDDAADVLMAARLMELVDTLIQFVDSSPEDMPGALPVGPTFGTDYLPLDPIAAMRAGKAHRIPLIVGTNADEGRLFARFLKLLPLTEPLIERLLAHTDSADRKRITAAYPGYPNPAACVQLAADCAFAVAAWQIAEAHGRHASAYLYRFDYAPRAMRWSGLGATHGTELLAVFDTYRSRFGSVLTGAVDRRSALRVSDDVQTRWHAFSQTGIPGEDWPAHTETDRAVMVFDRRSRIEYDPHAHRRLAWDGFSRASA